MANAIAMILRCGERQHAGLPKWACLGCHEVKPFESADPLCPMCRAEMTELDREVRAWISG